MRNCGRKILFRENLSATNCWELQTLMSRVSEWSEVAPSKQNFCPSDESNVCFICRCQLSHSYSTLSQWRETQILPDKHDQKAYASLRLLVCCQVVASNGHVRDLPHKEGSVNPENDFEMLWQVSPEHRKRLQFISSRLNGKRCVILATDPDREGEAISWHLQDILMVGPSECNSWTSVWTDGSEQEKSQRLREWA